MCNGTFIEKIKVTGYKSLRHTEFEPSPGLSILIGPNGSGKTNLLSAILLLKKLSTDYYYGRPDEPLATNECELKVWFRIEGKRAILTTKIFSYTDDNNNDVIVSSQQSWYLKDFTKNAKRYKITLSESEAFLTHFGHQPSATGTIVGGRYLRISGSRIMMPPGISASELAALEAIQSAYGLVSGLQYYSASRFTNPANCPVSFEIEQEGPSRRGVRLRGHGKYLYDLFNEYVAESDMYRQYVDIIGPNGIGLVDSIEFRDIVTSSIEYTVRSGGKVAKQMREKSLIIPQFVIGNNELSPNQLSEGTFKTLILLFYLITDKSGLLLIEEPEVCVHHGLLHSIMELIRQYAGEKQIVVSTHSDLVLDHVAPRDVHIVSMDDVSGTIVKSTSQKLSSAEFGALREYLESHGNLGEYWLIGGLED